MNPEFWAGKRVFLTGHTGFKGSWLALWLRQLGAEVTGYSLAPNTRPSLYELARVGEGITSHIGDIRDLPTLQAALQLAQPDIVIHMAAQPLVRESYRNPVETYATNIMGTVHMLEAVRHTPGIRAVVNVTTDKCYENREWHWGYREDEPMGGHDPYSNSKGCAELVTATYRNSFFTPVTKPSPVGAEHSRRAGPDPDGSFHAGTGSSKGLGSYKPPALATARAGNVIGGGDWAEDRLIPDILRAISEGRPVLIRNPHAIRPWQHVLEPLSGYLRLAQRLYEDGPNHAEAWNFGPPDDDARPVHWIAEYLTRAWGDGARWERDIGYHPHEATYLKLDCSKARACLEWRPRWQLAEALDRILAWQRAYLDGADLRQVTLAQIDEYNLVGNNDAL